MSLFSLDMDSRLQGMNRCVGRMIFASVLALSGCLSPVADTRPIKPEDAPPALSPVLPVPTASIPRIQPLLEEWDPAGCRWVRVSAGVTVGDRDTRMQVRADAVALAREEALAAVHGVNLSHRFLHYQQYVALRGETVIVENLLKTSQHGRVLKEVVVTDGFRDLPGCRACRYEVTLRDCVVSRPVGADTQFHVSAEMSETQLRVQDKVQLRVSATRDAYFYIYGVGLDSRACRIYPAPNSAPAWVAAGEALDIPGVEDLAHGRVLTARLPRGKNVSAETLRVIAARAPLPEWIVGGVYVETPGAGGGGSICREIDFQALIRSLNSTDIDWVEDARTYTITRARAR